MTKTHEFVLGKIDSSTDFEGHIVDVEYVISSVSDDIKVVDMWRDLGLNTFQVAPGNF